MPTPKKGARLGGSAGHQKHILSNLALALFEHLSLIHISEPTRRTERSRMPSSA